MPYFIASTTAGLSNGALVVLTSRTETNIESRTCTSSPADLAASMLEAVSRTTLYWPEAADATAVAGSGAGDSLKLATLIWSPSEKTLFFSISAWSFWVYDVTLNGPEPAGWVASESGSFSKTAGLTTIPVFPANSRGYW